MIPFRSRPHRRTAVFLSVLCTMVSAAHGASAQDANPASPTPPRGALTSKGPIPTRNSEPTNTPFLLPVPTDGAVLAKGKKRLGAELDIVNNLLTLTPRGYAVDFEEQRLNLDFARGLGDGQQVSIRLPVIARNGGLLEEFINSFHGFANKEGGGRGSIPNGRVLFRIPGPDGKNIFDRPGSAYGIGDITLEYRRSLTSGNESASVITTTGRGSLRRVAASARVLLKLPTGATGPLFGSGNADVGVGLAATVRPLKHLALHGNVTGVYLGKPNNDSLNPRRTLVHSLVAVEYLIDGRTSAVLQTDDNPAPIRTGIPYPDRSRRGLTVGLWRQLNVANTFYLSISENDAGVFARHAPDFTLSTGVRWGL